MDNVISRYTQEQAIEDGVLVKVGKTAKEVGFKQPVVFTAALMGACTDAAGTDFNGEPSDADAWIYDVLWMGMCRWKRMSDEDKASAKDGSVGPLDYELTIGTKVVTVWLSWNGTEAFTFMFPEDW